LGDQGAGRWRLTPGREYDVIGLEADQFRIIDDDGDPVLFPPSLFIVVKGKLPKDWIEKRGAEGERYAYPPQLDRVGFFEDWHDGQETARHDLSMYLKSPGVGGHKLADGFSLLSDLTRLDILKVLASGPKNVKALCQGLGMKQPAVSHHLGMLRMGRLVIGTRKGKSVIYACNAAAMKALAVGLAKLTPRK